MRAAFSATTRTPHSTALVTTTFHDSPHLSQDWTVLSASLAPFMMGASYQRQPDQSRQRIVRSASAGSSVSVLLQLSPFHSVDTTAGAGA
jgi:hypothetical protein